MSHVELPSGGADHSGGRKGGVVKQAGKVLAALAIARAVVGGIVSGFFRGSTADRRAAPPARSGQSRPPTPAGPEHGAGRLSPGSFWALLKDAGSSWLEDKAPRLGAALAYYTAFSLAPLLVIVTAIAGSVFGQDAVQGYLSQQIEGLVGPEGAKAIEVMVASASHPAANALASVIGIVTLFVGAVGLFGELQDALNTVWGVQPKPGRGFWGILRDRLLSFTMVLGTAFLLLISLVVSAALAALGHLFGDWGTSVVGQVVNVVLSFGVVTLLFAMIYRFLPDAKIAWRDVWLGAALTAALFTVGKFLIGLYLGAAGTASAYGAAGSLAVLLIWLYYSAQIFLFGAELTKAYANHFGTHIVPKANAVPVTDEARAEQGLARKGEPATRLTPAVRGAG